MAEATTRINRSGVHAALGKRDLSAILNELASVASQWILIGTCLEVEPSEINEIERLSLPPKEALLKLISRWLDTTNRTVTWADIIDALRQPALKEERVAQQIEDNISNRSIRKSISFPSETEQESSAKEYARSKSSPGPILLATSPSSEVKVQSEAASVDSLLESNAAQKSPLSVAESQSTPQVEMPTIQTDAPTLPALLSTTSVQTQTSDTSGTSSLEESRSAVPSSKKQCANSSFSCGCGECPVLDFFNDPNCCPNPVPTVSKLPYLNTSGLTEEEREELEIQLNDDYLSINQEYGTFAGSLRRSLKERGISPVELADCLMELQGYEPLSNSPEEKGVCLLENRYSEIKEAKDITRVFEILSDYSSFFNYDIVAFIAKNLGAESDKENLATYQAALEAYCRHHVFECPSYSSKSSRFPDLVLKVDPKVTESGKFTLKSLNRFKQKVAKTLKVTKYSLKLCSIKKGCLEITFQIPPLIKEAIVPLTNDQSEALQYIGVQNVIFRDAQSSLQQRPQPQPTYHSEVQGTKLLVTDLSSKLVASPPLHHGSHPADAKSLSQHQPTRSRICRRYLLLGECPFGAKCRYEHSGIPLQFKPAVDYVPVPSHISPSALRSFLGKVDQNPSRKGFIPIESDRAHVSPEIKIVAEDVDTLKFAKEIIVKKFEQSTGEQIQRARECIKYKLLGKCEHDPCKFIHGDIVESQSIGYVAHPVGKIPNLKKVIGRTGYCKGGLGCYMTAISDRDRNKEVKVIAENEAALEQAKKEIEVHFGQMHSLCSSSTTETIPLCYIHPEGINIHLQLKLQPCLDSQGKKQFTIEHESKSTPMPQAKELQVEDFEHLNLELPHPIYYLLDHPDETRELDIMSKRKAQVRLLSGYSDQIHKTLHDALNWMHRKNLHPKLEGRFGKLRWAKVPPFLERGPIDTRGFITFMFSNSIYERYFTTRVREANKHELIQNLTDLNSEVETYDIKIAVKNKGKHDIRLKFVDQKPVIMAVKRDEEKLLITDILCLHRKHDLRLSLNSYNAVPHDDPTVQRFVKTVHLPEDRVLTLVPQAQDKEWTARIIRHKVRRAYHINKKNYIATVSKINTYEITPDDLQPSFKQDELTIGGNDWKEHYEVELHNLGWEVDFGRQLGMSPEQSLSLLMDPTKIPAEVITSTAQQWNPDSIMEDFKGDRFLEMMDNINQSMEIPVQA